MDDLPTLNVIRSSKSEGLEEMLHVRSFKNNDDSRPKSFGWVIAVTFIIWGLLAEMLFTII